MSNPTELPDLDKLEAYATSSKGGDWHATEAMLNMLDEDDVLALVGAARRAQPEGEAPQAEVHKLDAAMSLLRVAAECDVNKISPAKLRNQVRESVADATGRNGVGEEYIFADVYDQLTEMLEPWMFRDGRDPALCPLPASVTESVEMLLEYFNRPAAQHVESGKEEFEPFGHFVTAKHNDGSATTISTRENDSDAFILYKRATGAPGTPEALANAEIPASPDLKKRMADALNVTLWLYRRLPGAYGRPPFVDAALLEMAKIADIEAQGSIAERAAQLDGGQGEGASHG